jgi:WD40 repeat protein
MFPEFHKDTIREICVSDGNKNLVISGGFDGSVFVTDMSRLCSDIQKNEKKSENSLYQCKAVVGSVNWHPRDHYLASCTTDTGILHIFDIRTDIKRPAIVFDTLRKVRVYYFLNLTFVGTLYARL